MEISARIFGVNSWSMLVPQALEGVATVGLVYLAVRRWFSAQAAILAGAVVALTPVAAMMFRYNNPDAMLALLLTGATYATMRGLERAQTKWLVLAGALVGFGFITKMMQAFLILPVMAVVYLLAAPTGWWRRVWQVVVMGVSVVVAAGWWVAAVALTPAADRPYVGGSQNNSILNLIFDYNGFGRLTGNESGSVGGGAGGASMWGPTGWTRLFNDSFGNMMSWLLPGALVMGAVLLLITIRARRTDRERAALLLWGGSLVCIGLTYQLGSGHHPPLLHGRPRPAARRAGRHRHHGPLGAARELGRPCRFGCRIGGNRDLERRPPGPDVRLVPCTATLRRGGGRARCDGHSGPALATGVPEAGRRPGGRARSRRCARRAVVLDRGHRGHTAQRRHPFGDADARGWQGGPGGAFPGVAAGRFPGGGGFRRAFGGGFPGGAFTPAAGPGTRAPAAPGARVARAARVARPVAGSQVAGPGGGFAGGGFAGRTGNGSGTFPRFGGGFPGAAGGGAGGGGFFNASQSNPEL